MSTRWDSLTRPEQQHLRDGVRNAIMGMEWSQLEALTLCKRMSTSERRDVLLGAGPSLAAQRDAILQNPKLFARIDALYQNRQQAAPNPEARRLIERYWRSMVRASGLGAACWRFW